MRTGSSRRGPSRVPDRAEGAGRKSSDERTIDSLQIGLEHYAGTLVFVSHDREFVGGLATRIIEMRPDGKYVDFRGTYDEYLKSQGVEI